MDSARQVIRWSIPGAVLMLSAGATFVAERLAPAFSFDAAAAPIRQQVSTVTALALTVPVGYVCYQIYNWSYSPLRWLKFVSANRGSEIISCLTDDQRTKVEQLTEQIIARENAAVSDSEVFCKDCYAHLANVLEHPKTQMNKRCVLRVLKWLELDLSQAEGEERGQLERELASIYHDRWWVHSYVASILLDVSTIASSSAGIKLQWTGASDIYHALGSTRLAIWAGLVIGTSWAWLKMLFNNSPPSADLFAMIASSVVVWVIGCLLMWAVNIGRARANRSSCYRLGYGLRTVFTREPWILDALVQAGPEPEAD